MQLREYARSKWKSMQLGRFAGIKVCNLGKPTSNNIDNIQVGEYESKLPGKHLFSNEIPKTVVTIYYQPLFLDPTLIDWIMNLISRMALKETDPSIIVDKYQVTSDVMTNAGDQKYHHNNHK